MLVVGLLAGRGALPTRAWLQGGHMHMGVCRLCHCSVEVRTASTHTRGCQLGIAKAKLEPRRVYVQHPGVRFAKSDAYS